MDPHGLGVHGDAQNTRREVARVLQPVLDVVQGAAQFDSDPLRCDADVDLVLPQPSSPDPDVAVRGDREDRARSDRSTGQLQEASLRSPL
jgi:hypothetical protein